MKKTLMACLITINLIGAPPILNAQETEEDGISGDVTLDGQFEKLYRNSNTYEEYKVISIKGYNELKSNARDSILVYKQEAAHHLSEIASLKNNLTATNDEIESLKKQLESVQNTKDSISILGLQLSKGLYNAVMWGIIICLVISSLVLFSMYKRGHTVVKSTQKRLSEVQDDLEKLRKNALVREQKLARELMDLKIKHKGR